jgi:periplasmic protein CpxP/Spy
MKKFILGAVAVLSLTYQGIAQTPSAPSATPTPAPELPSAPPPAPPMVPTQPTDSKEKADKHKGHPDNNEGAGRGEERPWENHKRKSKKVGKKEERKEHKMERKEQKTGRKEQKIEQKEQKIEQKEARGEKLDKMKAYLNLSADQETRLSAAIQSFRAGAKTVKEDKKLSPEQKKGQLERLVAERNAQLKAILTPEQLAKLAEAQKQGQAQGNKAKHGFISEEMGDEDWF